MGLREERGYGTEFVTGIEEPPFEGDHPISRTRRSAGHHAGGVRRNADREFPVLRPLHLSHTDELLPAAGDPAGWRAGADDLQVRQAARLPAGPAAVPRQATAVLRGNAGVRHSQQLFPGGRGLNADYVEATREEPERAWAVRPFAHSGLSRRRHD